MTRDAIYQRLPVGAFHDLVDTRENSTEVANLPYDRRIIAGKLAAVRGTIEPHVEPGHAGTLTACSDCTLALP